MNIRGERIMKNILFVHLCHHIEEIKVVVENGIQLYGKDESRCGE
jgi:hypothetical protein